MRDEGSARREPTGYKVRRAPARRQPRPSPRSSREKRTTCRLPLTGSTPYKGDALIGIRGGRAEGEDRGAGRLRRGVPVSRGAVHAHADPGEPVVPDRRREVL